MRYLLAQLLGVLLLGALCTGVQAQLNYTVSGGSQVFTPLGSVPASQMIDYTLVANSGSISPPGFSFPFEGTTYTEVRAWDTGVLVLGPTNPTPPDRFPSIGESQARVLAPYQAKLFAFTTGSGAWDYSGGVLIVEWSSMEDDNAPSGVSRERSSFQVLLDTSTGAIEFRYGTRSGSSYPPADYVYAVSVTGSVSGNGMITLPGSLNGAVDQDGRMTSWPTDSYIAFTPTGLSRSAPTISVEENLNPVAFGDVIDVISGDSVASLNLSILIGDPDGDPVAVTADPLSSEWTQSEFESPTATVPYALMPASGTLNNVGTHAIILTLDDGLDARRVFFFLVRVNASAPPGGGTGGTGGTGGEVATEIAATVLVAGLHACSVNPGGRGGLFALLLLALAGGVGVLRHRCPMRYSA